MRDVLMTERERIEVHRQAYWTHHYANSREHTILLPAPLVARILNRVNPVGPEHCMVTCYPDGRILWGERLIWKTGGDKVMQFVQTFTTERDLQALEHAEWYMWLVHCRAREFRDLPINRSAAPRFYRLGVELKPRWITDYLWRKYGYQKEDRVCPTNSGTT